jgi:hypothetical protein
MKGMASLAEEDWLAESFKLADEDVFSPEFVITLNRTSPTASL